ncbi:GDSL-type esterase/lipase family protein [Nocardioides sp. SYSU DS0651]|uniref:GDSL-type esterase/lipase family protein n=1 Tax=Nocardioides sp. SYSU DS0651 TaxID=3415955 RepID=UPI003F4B3442
MSRVPVLVADGAERTRRVATLTATLTALLPVLLALLVLPPGARAVAADDDPVRIMLLGDSVTQGSSGDWTWRYRLWQHLAGVGADVDFVGPRDDLWNLRTGEPGATSYADPAFDRDHAARWGMWAVFPDVPIPDLVAVHQPDVVVVMLGVNDLLYGVPTEQVSQRLRDVVAEARSVRPDVDVVLAEATQRWFAGVPELDAAMAAAAEELSTEQSRVVLAPASAGYELAADTWDGSHPNARGEVRIAAAVADALATLGVGAPVPRPLVLPPVGPVVGATLSATRGDRRATLAWVGPDGATSHRLWRRDTDVTKTWSLVPGSLPRDGTRAVTGLVNGHHYEFRLQPVKGDDEPEGPAHSNVVRVAPAAPRLVAPSRLRGVAGRRCARLTWTPVTGARAYLVQRRGAHRWTRGRRVAGTRVVLTRLPAARAWRFRVRAVRGAEAGPVRVVRVARRHGTCRAGR